MLTYQRLSLVGLSIVLAGNPLRVHKKGTLSRTLTYYRDRATIRWGCSHPVRRKGPDHGADVVIAEATIGIDRAGEEETR